MSQDEKKITELRLSLGLLLAYQEAHNPFRFVAWFGKYLFLKWFRLSSKDFFEVYMEDRNLRKENWIKKHADPLFGLPDDDYEWLELVSWNFSKAPFRPARVLKVTVRLKGPPSPEHREIFLWLEKNIHIIRSFIPDLLLQEAQVEGHTECYGEAGPERAAVAFAPENIFLIEFRDSDPVLWDVHAHHAIKQDVYITVEGKDEIVTRAFLSM